MLQWDVNRVLIESERITPSIKTSAPDSTSNTGEYFLELCANCVTKMLSNSSGLSFRGLIFRGVWVMFRVLIVRRVWIFEVLLVFEVWVFEVLFFGGSEFSRSEFSSSYFSKVLSFSETINPWLRCVPGGEGSVLYYLRNRNTSGSVRERKMLWEHQPTGEYFEFSQTFY